MCGRRTLEIASIFRFLQFVFEQWLTHRQAHHTSRCSGQTLSSTLQHGRSCQCKPACMRDSETRYSHQYTQPLSSRCLCFPQSGSISGRYARHPRNNRQRMSRFPAFHLPKSKSESTFNGAWEATARTYQKLYGQRLPSDSEETWV